MYCPVKHWVQYLNIIDKDKKNNIFLDLEIRKIDLP